MCDNFIKYFTDKVIQETNYIQCDKGQYYKKFDENLIKMIIRIDFRRDISEDYYVDLAIYFFHKDVKRFIEVLKVLKRNKKLVSIAKIADIINNSHKDCFPQDNEVIIFLIYDKIGWHELDYVEAEDRNLYFGEKEKLTFNSWLTLFLNYFCI